MTGNGSNGDGMSSTEKWYWVLVALMIAVILVHISPYHLYVWSYTKYRDTFPASGRKNTDLFAADIFLSLASFPRSLFWNVYLWLPPNFVGRWSILSQRYADGITVIITNNSQY